MQYIVTYSNMLDSGDKYWNENVIQKILARGGNIFLKNNNGETPIDIATKMKRKFSFI